MFWQQTEMESRAGSERDGTRRGGRLVELKIGDTVRFRRPSDVEAYGPTATVVARQRVEYRRALPGYDRSSVLIDLRTAGGLMIQWTASEVRRRTR